MGGQRADDGLRPELERLRVALRAAGVGAWTWDITANAVWWSDGLAALFGLAVDAEPIGVDVFLARVYPDDREAVSRSIAHALAAKAEHAVEHRVARPDGKVRWLCSRGGVELDASGTPLRIHGIVQDVTERRAAEQRQNFLAAASDALAASLNYETTLQDLARLTVPTVADACVIDVLEPSGEIRPVASYAEPPIQAVLEDLRRRYPATMDRPHGVARVLTTGLPTFLPQIREEQREELAIDAEHLRLLRALGTRSNLSVPLVARGEILGALTLKRIGPEYPLYGPADLVFAEELGCRTALALDNARLLRAARSAVSLRDEFLSSASHDLKNPLTAIQGRVQLLQRRAGRDDPMDHEALVHGLDEIATAARKMQRMIDELQDLSSLQIGRPLELDLRPKDLVALARDIVAGAREISSRHQVQLGTSERALIAEIDPGRMGRVLDNLIGNAIKYSPGGGDVTVTVRREPVGDGEVCAALAVVDHGVGIPAGDMPSLFERFFRGSNVAGRFAGSGIGLAGARQIVTQHGGTITVESQEGAGSTFTVRLPLHGEVSGSAATT